MEANQTAAWDHVVETYTNASYRRLLFRHALPLPFVTQRLHALSKFMLFFNVTIVSYDMVYDPSTFTER